MALPLGTVDRILYAVGKLLKCTGTHWEQLRVENKQIITNFIFKIMTNITAHARVHRHARTGTHAQARAQARTQAHALTGTRAQAHAHKHARARRHTNQIHCPVELSQIRAVDNKIRMIGCNKNAFTSSSVCFLNLCL